MLRLSFLLLCGVFLTQCTLSLSKSSDEAAAAKALLAMDQKLQPLLNKMSVAEYAKEVNSNKTTRKTAADTATAYQKEFAAEHKGTIMNYNFSKFKNAGTKRQFMLQVHPGVQGLDAADYKTYSDSVSKMTENYLSKVCTYKANCDKNVDKLLTMDKIALIMANETDMDVLSYYWKEWRDKTGKPSKGDFVQTVKMMNKAAKLDSNGFKDAAEMWVQPFTADKYNYKQFITDIDDMWSQLEKYYVKLFSYVRWRLINSKPYSKKFGKDSPIPAHILGNMWAQSWENIYDLVKPYKDSLVQIPDISNTLQDKANVSVMFKLSERFFKSIGLSKMADSFYNDSYMKQRPGYNSMCHASAWDMYSVEPTVAEDDFRIKMCTNLDQTSFTTIHHEMGHIEYFMSYAKTGQNPTPLIFRDGANPGFHEAIGDTINLSVGTVDYLEMIVKQLGGKTFNPSLTPAQKDQRDINQLMYAALEKFAFLPYAYIVDKYRWAVFEGNYTDNYNYEWWKLRTGIQGVKPPVLREKDSDFDPASKFHVSENVPYVSYFAASMLQYQFHEKLCNITHQTNQTSGDFYQCNIYNQSLVSIPLTLMLGAGRSKAWPTVLGDFLAYPGTGSSGKMSTAAIIKYFGKLWDYLDAQQKEHKYPIKWDKSVDRYFVSHISALVPIVVGSVLGAMILIVVVAYFVGKSRSTGLEPKPEEVETTGNGGQGGMNNSGFEMDQQKKEEARRDSHHSHHSKSSSSSSDSHHSRH